MQVLGACSSWPEVNTRTPLLFKYFRRRFAFGRTHLVVGRTIVSYVILPILTVPSFCSVSVVEPIMAKLAMLVVREATCASRAVLVEMLERSPPFTTA